MWETEPWRTIYRFSGKHEEAQEETDKAENLGGEENETDYGEDGD